MKLSGIAGTGSGKLGSQVYASVAGEQVVRNYQPKVSNPNTSKQVSQRARMKLLSQLSAVFAPVLTYKRNKMVSARNQFTKRNFDWTAYNNGVAQVSLENLQITSGSAGLPGITIARAGGTFANIHLNRDASKIADRVCYVIFKKNDNQRLQLVNSIVITNAGEGGYFPTYMFIGTSDVVVYAYGMKDLNSRASAKYSNYTVETGEDIAKLIATRGVNFNDFRFTRTRGVQLYAGEDEAQSAGINQSRIFLTTSGNGSVSGMGTYDNGTEVTISAVPDEGATFVGWKINGSDEYLAFSPTYKFTAGGQVDLLAVFQTTDSQEGGLDGETLANPLPFDRAQVELDGNEVDIKTGLVTGIAQLNSISVANVAPNQTMTFVPTGSTLGADDNITLVANAGIPGTYEALQMNASDGIVYYNNNVFFYIESTSTPTLPTNATISVDSTSKTLIDGQIFISEKANTITIGGVAEGHRIVYVPVRSSYGAADNIIATRQLNNYVLNLSSQTLAKENGAKVYYEGEGWFTITRGEEPGPVFNENVLLNNESVNVSSGNVSVTAPLETMVISGQRLANVTPKILVDGHEVSPIPTKTDTSISYSVLGISAGESVDVYQNADDSERWFHINVIE